ncbi:MAG: extracellular solute-binding protein [bacterium]
MRPSFKPISFILLLALFVTTGQGCFGGSEVTELEKVKLEYWRVFDDEDAFETIIDSYRALHPNVSIEYRKLRFDEYEDELIRAFAEGRGPDIFAVHNTWMREYQDLMMPMPSSVTITSQEQRGTVRREVVTVQTTNATMSMKTLKSVFVEQVPEDVILEYQPDPKIDAEERIYGLPLALDTLALFYNKDLLNAAGIPNPAETWSDFQDQVEALTTINSAGAITQSGAALGTADNVERSTDILSLLMMQNGTPMVDERGRVAFNTVPDDAPEGVFPGLDAVEFYTDFANPTKAVYSWNEDYTGSFEAFANGETAFFVGYSYHIPLIRTAAPKLNFGIAEIPQITGGREVNFANYWIESVSASTDYEDWAWDFVLFAADEDNVGSYLAEAEKPTALRNLISTQLEDELLGPFVMQALTAEHWYKGNDYAAVEEAFGDLITAILAGPEDPEDVIGLTARTVSQTY